MTNPQSEDLVSVSFSMPKAAVIRPPTEVLDPAPGWQFITDASTGYHHHLPTPEWLQEQADRIQQLEREKAEAETEAATLARALMAHYQRADVEWLLTYATKETKQALTIAKRRVNGE